jgi:hypothetical protein
MKISIYILLITLIIQFQVKGQNFIGMHKNEIASLMKETQKEFILNKDVVNKKYNYLKYEDRINEQTVLYFLDNNDYCTYVRFISDYSNYNSLIDTLNKKYKRRNENTWIYTDKGVKYIVYLEKEEWFFTINTKKKKKKNSETEIRRGSN